tara:strand:- start:379 stop:1899 length:1521 start_codon:yes stop_codon:yes gene_type:complete
MSAIQNYLSKAQDFSQEVSQEQQLDSAREQVKEKAIGNIEQVRDRVEELKAGISGDVGAFGFGAAGAIEKGFQYGKYASEKAAKLKESVDALKQSSGFNDTVFGRAINDKISNLISPDSALGRHLQTAGEQVKKLQDLTVKNPLTRTEDIMNDVESRFDNLMPKGKDEFRRAVDEKNLRNPLSSGGDPTEKLEEAIKHNELMKQVEGVPDNVIPGLIGGAEPGKPLVDNLEPTQQEIREGQATTQDFSKLRPPEELGSGRRVRIRQPGESRGRAVAPAAEEEEELIKAVNPRTLATPGERVLADITSGGGAAAPKKVSFADQTPTATEAAEAAEQEAARDGGGAADPIQAPSVSGAPEGEPIATPTGDGEGEAETKFTDQQETQEKANIQTENTASQEKSIADQQEEKVQKTKGNNEEEGGEEDLAEEGASEGILGALGPVGDVLAAGSAIYGLARAEVAKRQESKEQTDLQSYYDSLSQIQAPNLGSLAANVLDSTDTPSAFTNF